MLRADDWPLVGRAEELASIAALLRSKERSAVVLAGPAGVGKTRLATESGALAARAGFRVVTAWASEAARSIPLGALAAVLGPEPPRRRELRADLLRRVADQLSTSAEPMFLIVDDAHLLDDASAALVHQLSAERAAFVAVTTRSGEPAPDPVLRLWKDGIAVRLDLGTLDRSSVRELVEAVLGTADGATHHELWVRSRGNALYLRELVVGGVESGALVQSAGLWRLAGNLATTPRLTELVETRLAGLDDRQRAALELVSAGEPLDIRLVESIADAEALDALDHRGLLAIDRSGERPRLSLAHPLHGEVLRSAMSPLRRVAVHRALADAIGDEPIESCDLVRAALWQLESGGDTDRDLMLAAARRAYFDHGDELAERLARAALAAGAGPAAGVVLLQVLGESGRHDERIALARELMEAAASPDGDVDDATASKVVMEWAHALYWGRADEEAALDQLARQADVVHDPAVRDELLALAASFHLLGGRLAEAIEASEPILDRGRDRALVEAATAAGPALALAGRGERAVHIADVALSVALSLGEQDSMADPGLQVVTRMLASIELGDLHEVAAIAAAAYDEAVAIRSRTGQGWIALMRGRVALQTGDIAGARRWFGESSVLLADVGWPGARRWAVAGRILAAAAAGDVVEAESAGDELDQLPAGPAQMMEPEIVRAQAWLAHVRGDDAGRDRALDRAAASATSSGALALAVLAWHDIARLGRAREAAGELGKLATCVDGPYADVRAAHAAALARDDADGLVAAADRFESLGAVLLAAEAMAAASAARRRARSTRAAQALARRAHDLAARCPGAATPALELAGPAALLTTREREVATLAAGGMASKEIAVRFARSVRTVDNLLQRAYRKLGVSSRDALADALSSRGRDRSDAPTA